MHLNGNQGSAFERTPTERVSIIGWAVLVLCSIFIAVSRLHTIEEPFERDIVSYILQAREISHGAKLYVDTVEFKPPAVFTIWQIADALCGTDVRGVYIVNVLVAILSMLGIYRAILWGGGTLLGACWGAVFWTIISGEMGLQANQPNMEVFINASVVWSIALWLLWWKTGQNGSKPKFLWLALAGLLATLASMFKHHVVLVFVCISVGLVAAAWRDRALLRRELTGIAGIGLIGTACWAALLGYYWIDGRLSHCLDALVSTAISYGTSGHSYGVLGNLKVGLTDWLLPSEMCFLMVLAGLTGTAVVTAIFCQRKREAWLLLSWALGIFLVIFAPGRFYRHYYQLTLPLFALGGGLGIAAIRKWVPLSGACIVGAATLAFLGVRVLPEYLKPANEWSMSKYGPIFIETRRYAGVLNELLPKGTTFYVWGIEPGLHYYSGRPMPTPFIGPGFPEKQFDFWIKLSLAHLEESKPEAVVICDNCDLQPEHPIVQWMQAHYLAAEMKPSAPHFSKLLVRKGGALARQIEEQGIKTTLLELKGGQPR